MDNPNQIEEWPQGYEDNQQRMGERYNNPARYEGSWNGDLNAIFTFILPCAAPFLFTTHPQFVLRAPVPGIQLDFFDETQDGPDLVDPNPFELDLENIDDIPAEDALQEEEWEEDPPVANISHLSYGYSVQGRGQGREIAVCIPDFILDQRNVDGRRRLVALVEVKASHYPKAADLERFTKYARRLDEIHNSGVDLSDVLMLLIAGGRVYTWDFDNWPREVLTRAALRGREFIRAHSVEFLALLGRMRTLFENTPWPPAP